MTPYFSRAGITIYHGRAEDVLPTLAAGSVDLVVTSPPYNLGGASHDGMDGTSKRAMWKRPALANGYASHADDMPHAEYVAWQREILLQCWRLLSERGAIFYNHKPRLRDGLLWTPLELNPGLPLRQIVIWDRLNGFNFGPAHFAPQHEWLMIFARPGFALVERRSTSAIGDVWRIGAEQKNPHPAPFPVLLPKRAIGCTDARVILDPFMGSGTTMVAAQALGRAAIGVEVHGGYCDMAIGRLGQQPLGLEVAG